MPDTRHTASTITDDALDALYEELAKARSEARVAEGDRDAAETERDATRERFVGQATAATELIAELGTTEAELVAARSAIDRVRALHQPMDLAGFMYCGHCSSWDGQRVRGVLTDWPCDTVAALPAAEEQQPAEHVGDGANAEDCPACSGTNPPYPFICPGAPVTA